MAFAIASTPGVYDVDFDGFADVIYVGDLGGNVWKWVVNAVGHDAVNPTPSSTSQPAWHFEKFFAAEVYDSGTTKHYRSFFFNPSATLRNGVLWLALGSGERADLNYAGDPAGDDENRFYALKDLDPLARNAGTQAPKPISEDPAVDATPLPLLDITAVGTSCSGATVGDDGYYFEGVEGEKWVTATDIFFYYVFSATFTPETNSDPCATGGRATLYAFKVYCGEGLFEDAGGNPVTTISLGDGMPTDPKVSLSGEEGGSRVFINKKDEVLSKDTGFSLDDSTGQAYWREIH
jgi:type IV pilus assembly protein PilY1